MANYIVTGAAGFIASRVCEILITEGHSVVGIDNLCNAYDVRLKSYRLHRLQQLPRFTFTKTDICDRSALESIFEQTSFDAIINLAARAGVRASVENPWVFVDTNMTGTLNLLELCRQRKYLNLFWHRLPVYMEKMLRFQLPKQLLLTWFYSLMLQVKKELRLCATLIIICTILM